MFSLGNICLVAIRNGYFEESRNMGLLLGFLENFGHTFRREEKEENIFKSMKKEKNVVWKWFLINNKKKRSIWEILI